jgi:protein transport protein SEC24
MCSIDFGLANLYPRFWALNDFISNPEIGRKGNDGKVTMPPRMNLSSEKLNRDGVFMIENGLEILIWIGRSVNPGILGAIFGQQNLDLVPLGKVPIPKLDNELNERFHAVINAARETRLRQATVYLQSYVIREDGDVRQRTWFLSHLIEDRLEPLLSYPQFLATIREEVQKAK